MTIKEAINIPNRDLDLSIRGGKVEIEESKRDCCVRMLRHLGDAVTFKEINDEESGFYQVSVQLDTAKINDWVDTLEHPPMKSTKVLMFSTRNGKSAVGEIGTKEWEEFAPTHWKAFNPPV